MFGMVHIALKLAEGSSEIQAMEFANATAAPEVSNNQGKRKLSNSSGSRNFYWQNVMEMRSNKNAN